VIIYLVISSLLKEPLISIESEYSAARKSFDYGMNIGHEASLKGGKVIKDNLKYFWILSFIWLSISTILFDRDFNLQSI